MSVRVEISSLVSVAKQPGGSVGRGAASALMILACLGALACTEEGTDSSPASPGGAGGTSPAVGGSGAGVAGSGGALPPSGGTGAASGGAGAPLGGAPTAGVAGTGGVPGGGTAGEVSGGGVGGGGVGGGDAGAAGAGASATVDPSTMLGKNLFGYQGWFSAPGDGSDTNRFHHWLDGDGLKVDMWPDVSEFDADELFPLTGMQFANGDPGLVFSSYTEKTVLRHFRWMREYGIDGVLLQRFLGEVQDPVFFEFRNTVTQHARAGAEAEGRVFAIEYDLDLSGEGLNQFRADWTYLVDTLGVLDSPAYLHHEGRPVVAIWGIGFTHRGTTAAQAAELIQWLHTDADPRYQAAVVGGVPTNWRTLDGDAKPEAEWTAVYHSLDVVSPWAVGRYGDDAGADSFRTTRIEPDLAQLQPRGIEYLPVVFPGFSWFNMHDGPLNQIPRNGGRFYWRQVYNALDSGSTMIKTAMFDEVDEGTAMFKMAATAADAPSTASFVTLDADGEALPSDHYLTVSGLATQMLRGELPLSAELPGG